MKAVVLLSGGLDSATALAMAQAQRFEAYALSFDYGQRHKVELEAARRVARRANAQHHEAKINLRAFAGSALTSDLAVPKNAELGEIPATYVPARNTIFLSLALAWAEVLGADAIFIGANAVDYSGYPDCRPEYLAAFEAMANLATRRAVEGRRMTIHAPLIDLTKAEIIRRGLDLGVDYALTFSCYDPQPDPCHECDSCRLRQRGFAAALTTDPAQGGGI